MSGAVPFGFGQDGSPFPPHPTRQPDGNGNAKPHKATATASAPAPRPPPLPQGAHQQEMQWRKQNGYPVQPSYPSQSFAPGQLIIPPQQKQRASSFSPISPGAAPFAAGPRHPSQGYSTQLKPGQPVDMPPGGYYRSASVGPPQHQQHQHQGYAGGGGGGGGGHFQSRSYDDRPPAPLPPPPLPHPSSSYHAAAPMPQPRRASNNNAAPPPAATLVKEARRSSADATGAPVLAMPLTDMETLTARREKALAANLESMKLDWARLVVRYVERVHADAISLTDPTLIRYVDEAMAVINRRASSSSPDALGLYMRGDLRASGNFPSYHRKDPKNAFNDFELSGRLGHAASWFRIGQDYEHLDDPARAREAYARGQALRDVGCIYRMGMMHLMGQIGAATDYPLAMSLLKEASELSNEETPQPSYVLGMLFHGEFSHIPIPAHLFSPIPDPAQPRVQPTKERTAYHLIERSAFLNFAPAQYKLGWAYEYAQLDCPFDPLLSVQYYSLASKGGEVEADMAVSKWFLCGAEGCFDKNESLAYLFAEKAARRGLASAEFALAYYHEVGVGCNKDVPAAKGWYKRAAARGNADAKERLEALEKDQGTTLSRSEHEAQLDVRLQRKHTAAQALSQKEGRRARDQRQMPPLPTGGTSGQETLSTGFEHLNLKNQGGGGQQQTAAKPPRDVRRRQTMRMVDDAASWRGLPSRQQQQTPAPPLPQHQAMPMPTPQPYRATTPQPAPARQPPATHMATPPHPQGRRPSSTMSPAPAPPQPGPASHHRMPPAPFPSGPSGPSPAPNAAMMGRRNPSSQGGPHQQAPSSSSGSTSSPPRKDPQKFDTFEEMGFASSAVGSGKDCVVM